MIVSVTTSGVRYEDMETFTRFHVDAHGLSPAEFEHQVADASSLTFDSDANAVWMTVAELRAETPETKRADFDGMIAYAASKGWVSNDGSRVRAHIERLGE